MIGPALYGALRAQWKGHSAYSWLSPLLDESERLLGSDTHGDLPAWREVLSTLPDAEPFFDGDSAAPCLGRAHSDPGSLAAHLQGLHPWRKGPLEIGGVRIDAEWRSDLKWDRIAPHLDLAGHRVLDVGCGNGYFGWRMLGAGASLVLGVDPTLVFVMQWAAASRFGGAVPNWVLPLGIERLPERAPCFDSVFSMGVLYHRKDPVRHLRHLSGLARPGGQIILETLVLDLPGVECLIPRDRYARMRNVWAVPTPGLLRQWLKAAGLPQSELLDMTKTTTDEQRSTDWMRFESLDRALNPDDHGRTVEGYPAPVRAALRIEVPQSG